MQIDFYILSAESFSTALGFTCRLVEKAFKPDQEITILLENAKEAQALDELLWTFKSESFIPHQLSPESPEQILVGRDLTNYTHKIFLNMTLNELPSPQSYHRLLQIVPNQTHLKERGRKLYRSYQAMGYSIQTHTINQS